MSAALRSESLQRELRKLAQGRIRGWAKGAGQFAGTAPQWADKYHCDTAI
ncbi:MAG: hypothetical protein P3X23_009540 [Thermosynechococcus sp. Uc]|nr:hypothetical protein [Thermosynechococcus sp. Uc]MDM7327339.1 hypothetical protein [Thermosynechococcus sp. Uc]